RLDRLALHGRRDRPEGRTHGPLPGPGAAFDRRRGLLRIAAGGDQRGGVLAQPFDAHVEDERAGEGGECVPVECRLRLLRVLVAGDEGDRGGVVAVGDGDPGVGGRGDPGGHAGDDLELDPGRAQRFALLGAAAEDERVAALPPHHAAPPWRPRRKPTGSPPFSRTTLRPARAASISRSPISSWGTEGTPGCLPT